MKEEIDLRLQRLSQDFASCLSAHCSLDRPLDELVEVTGARAAGLWLLRGNRLELLGFRGATDMAREVRQGFAEATRSVPVTEVGLGIVKAVVRSESTPAHVDEGGMTGSAGWLRKFEAEQSLAVPLLQAGGVQGVLAVSLPKRFRPGSPTWLFMEKLAVAVAPWISQESGGS